MYFIKNKAIVLKKRFYLEVKANLNNIKTRDFLVGSFTNLVLIQIEVNLEEVRIVTNSRKLLSALSYNSVLYVLLKAISNLLI